MGTPLAVRWHQFDRGGSLKQRLGIAFRLAMALLVAATVLVPVAAQAATCSMPACSSGCCMMGDASGSAAMSMDSCCSMSGPTMKSSQCPSGSERPDFKATSGVPEAVSPAVPLGAASLVGPAAAKRATGLLTLELAAPGDRLAGTRLLV